MCDASEKDGTTMITILRQMVVRAKSLNDAPMARQIAIALMRITLQHACVGLAEWLVTQRDIAPNAENLSVFPDLEPLRAPADGTLLAKLAELLVYAENAGWTGLGKCLWQPIPATAPCTRLSRSANPNMEMVLVGFIALRNDGVEGHGIPGDYDIDAEINAVEMALSRLSPILPAIDADSEALILSIAGARPYRLQTLRCSNQRLICYRKLQKTNNGRCSVRAQIQIDLFTREDFVYETIDVFSEVERQSLPTYAITRTYNPEWSPFTLLSERITEYFTGRSGDIAELENWINDTESRACLLFGDGGIGKTTLAVEFVHRLLEGKTKTNWRPEMLTFYTAKQTRWGLKGMEVIRAREVGIADVAHTVVRSVEGKPLGREWFVSTPDALIQKLAGYLSEFGISRHEHLLILDNTETMSRSEDDTKLLVQQIQELSRRVGRIIVTSRRREQIEARQIEIKPLTDQESLDFLRKRGRALDRRQIMSAGDPTLRQFARKLGNKPLVLEVFIHALGETSIGLQHAFDRVLRMQRQDLGEFLYSDAWKRMSPNLQHLLLLMTRVFDIHDDFSLKLSCMQVKVTVIEAMEALEESRGIAGITRINGQLQIAFHPEFLKFCEARNMTISGQQCPTPNAVDTVKRRYNEFLRSAQTKVADRIDLAYKHALARAAWLAFQEGRKDDCELFYEEAVVADSANGWLYDRYAYFLLSERHYERALDQSTTATELLPNDPETWFTRGMIEARLGKTEDALRSLNWAAKNGKPPHLCLLQRAYAYLNSSPPDKARALRCLDESETVISRSDPYYFKHISEIQRTKYRIKSGMR
jgi:tetratricopeptide (TPR) repeat protein